MSSCIEKKQISEPRHTNEIIIIQASCMLRYSAYAKAIKNLQY